MLKVNSISKSFKKNQRILNEINIDIQPNSCYCLLGKNGSGKSTLFNIIGDLLPADSGEIFWRQKEILKCLKEFKKNTGFMLDSKVLISEFTGIQFLKFIASVYGLGKIIEPEILKITDYFFDDKNDLQKRIVNYSTGMKQKLSFCAAVLHKPEVLILDEPFAGLDAAASNRLIQFLKRYMKNRVIVISSHDLSYVEKIATHIGVVDDGSLRFNESIDEFVKSGEIMIDSALFKYIQPKKYSVSLDELTYFL